MPEIKNGNRWLVSGTAESRQTVTIVDFEKPLC